MKKRIYEILEPAPEGDWLSKAVDIFIMIVILLNVIAVILETLEGLADQYADFFRMFEIISVGIFTVEYFLRLWTCTVDQRFNSPVKGRLRYVFTPLAMVDFLAILPFYLPLILEVDLRFMRILRLFRIFRLFKLIRYSMSLQFLGHVFRAKKEELLITMFFALILLVFASGLMYFFENKVQPQAFASIPAAMWWGVATLTTVGYGDIYPITPIGKLVGGVIAILGIGMFALPAGILASGFAEEIQNRKNAKQEVCPHCGGDLTSHQQ